MEFLFLLEFITIFASEKKGTKVYGRKTTTPCRAIPVEVLTPLFGVPLVGNDMLRNFLRRTSLRCTYLNDLVLHAAVPREVTRHQIPFCDGLVL